MSGLAGGSHTGLQLGDLTRLVASRYPDRIVDVQREEIQRGTHPKEVITYRFATGQTTKLLIKYESERPKSFGHRGGVAYEARVYSEVLPMFDLDVPAVLGSEGPERGRPWLALDYLEGAVRIANVSDITALVHAAEYVGLMHRRGDQISEDLRPTFLTQYDRSYYSGWASRAVDRLADPHPWIVEACHAFDAAATELSTRPRTLIHGEFYPKNILWLDGDVYPIDWESAAYGLGEIDLATLAEGWPAEVEDACRKAYAASRWPSGPPHEFWTRLTFSIAYAHLRWLSEFGDLRSHAWRLERLRSAASRLAEVR